MKYLKPLFILSLTGFLVGIIVIASFYIYMRPELPSVEILKDVHLQTPMKIYSQDGKLISQYGIKRRIPLSLDQIPQHLINAVIATEDSRFYDHPGIDIIGVVRAAINLITTGEKGQGASTLTMQLARGFFLTREKAYMRKIKEIFIAWHIEQLLSKEEILELYLNKNELGHRAFGVGAAAQVYYGKDVNELTLAQMATIAGLLQAPSILNPISRPERSKQRRRIVLLRMLDENLITRAQFDEAAAAPVTAIHHGAEIELKAPYVAELAYNEMIERYGKEQAETAGFNVYLTTSAHLQNAAQHAVIQNLHDYDERHGYRGIIRQLWKEPVVVEEQITDADDMLDNNIEDQDMLDDGTDSNEMATEAATQMADSIESILQNVREPNPDSPRWTDEQLIRTIKQTDVYSPLEVAVVLGVEEQSIQVINGKGEYLNINWDGLAWARPYISDTHQGPAPQKAADIVKVGALVYIKMNSDSGQWQLSQFPGVSGALVSLNPKDGAIQALIGGYSFYQSQFNRATQAKRQVGSNIKPFIYSAALDSGYTIASIINDAPINNWDRASGMAWRPKNSPEVYDGPIRMRVGLGKSKNVVSVRLLRGVGLDKIINHLARFGFNPNELPRDESLSLGSASLTPMEVATGFAVFNNGGYAVTPYLIQRIEDLQGEIVWKANPKVACRECNAQGFLPDQLFDDPLTPKPTPVNMAPQVLDPQNAFLVTEMLRTGIRGGGNYSKNTYWQGTGWRARNILQRDDIAGKTGTTNDARDAWFSGFSPDLVTTIWVGFDNMGRVLGRTSRNQYLINKNPQRFNWMGNAMIGSEDGARVAQPAWIRYMQVATDGVPERPFYMPEGIATVRIDRGTGKLTQRSDHTSLFEYFKKGSEPTQYVRDDELVDPFVEGQENQLAEPEDIF
ncbi:penicillin-binding protein 1A [Alteromonadaceae bacterium BrNp21-10]|nr:penicillin-binding protein 1A [Alteromonadaceae bacterium BrNp21-10]